MSARTDVAQPRLGPVGWLRWTWRQLTSMRTALFLLLLLAIGAIPGSTFPQRSIDPGMAPIARSSSRNSAVRMLVSWRHIQRSHPSGPRRGCATSARTSVRAFTPTPGSR